MSHLIQDVRYSLRTFRRNPAFSVVAVLTLALGIGANIAVFSVVDGVVLRPLDVPSVDRVVQVTTDVYGLTRSYLVSIRNAEDYRDKGGVFETMALFEAFTPREFYLQGTDRLEKVATYLASPDLLRLLGVTPTLGRGFVAEEGYPDGPVAAILTHSFWQRHFGGDPDAVGRILSITLPNETVRPFTVVGVLPPDFRLPPVTTNRVGGFGGGLAIATDYDFLSSFSFMGQNAFTRRGNRNFALLARLKPGVTLQQAQTSMERVAVTIQQEDPQVLENYTVAVNPLRGGLIRAYGSGLYFLWAAAGLALLIVCVNLANLLLTRAFSREREMAVRLALGSGRKRLLVQLLTETTVLGVLGGGIGILLGIWGTHILVSLLPQHMFGLGDVSFDLRVLAFAALASISALLLIGSPPAIRGVRGKITAGLQEGARGSSRGGASLQRGLVVAQVALALLMLTGAGLILSSHRNLTNVDPGMDRENVLMVRIEKLPGRLSKYTGRAAVDLFKRILDRVESLPGVISAGGIGYPPLTGTRMVGNFTLADYPPPEEGEPTRVFNSFGVTPGYFDAAGIRLQEGRWLTETDYDRVVDLDYETDPVLWRGYWETSEEEKARITEQVEKFAVVNDVWAQRFFPGESAIGKGFYWGTVDPENPPPWLYSIVGVAQRVKSKTIDEPSTFPQAWVLSTSFRNFVVVRTEGDPLDMADWIRREIEAVDPLELSVRSVRAMEGYYRDATAQSRSLALLTAAFAVLATLLAALGVFGVMAYMVANRIREIGIRMSLGAQPREIFRLVLGQGLLITGAGIAIGLAASFLLARFIASVLFGVESFDLPTSATMVILIGLVAFAACYLPTRQASRVNPVEALRTE